MSVDRLYTGHSLCVLIPAYDGKLPVPLSEGLTQLRELAVQKELSLNVLYLSNESLVQRARNELIYRQRRGLKSEFVLFIDSDIIFRPPDVFTLLDTLIDHPDRELTAALYPKKHLEILDVVRFARAFPDLNADLIEVCTKNYVVNTDVDDVSIDNVKTAFKNGDTCAEVGYLPTGFMMIRSTLLDRMPAELLKHGFDLHYTRDHDGGGEAYAYFHCIIHPKTKRYLSEDYAFSYFCHLIGAKRYLHLGIALTHVGRYNYRGHPVGLKLKIEAMEKISAAYEQAEKLKQLQSDNAEE